MNDNMYEQNKYILFQNKNSWDLIADDWFGATALPSYGVYCPDENQLNLLGDLKNKKILDIGCGSGHSLLWCKKQGAGVLWGVDLSSRQVSNAAKLLNNSGYSATLVNAPMEESEGIPIGYFDVVYSIYAIGWTTDIQKTFDNIYSYLKKDGIFVFSWDHPLINCIELEDNALCFTGNYNAEETMTFEKGGNPVTLIKRKLSTYINALAKAGFCVEKVIEDVDTEKLKADREQHSAYYSGVKAEHYPLSFIIKARKV